MVLLAIFDANKFSQYSSSLRLYQLLNQGGVMSRSVFARVREIQLESDQCSKLQTRTDCAECPKSDSENH